MYLRAPPAEPEEVVKAVLLGDSAWRDIEAHAVELRKRDTGLTREQAIDQVCRTDPDLYNRYLEQAAGE